MLTMISVLQPQDIKGLYGLPHLAINLWYVCVYSVKDSATDLIRRIVGVFTLGATIVNLPLGFIEHSVTPIWYVHYAVAVWREELILCHCAGSLSVPTFVSSRSLCVFAS
jgi:hypothetical protein